MLDKIEFVNGCIEDIDSLISLYENSILKIEKEIDKNLADNSNVKNGLKEYFTEMLSTEDSYLLVAKLDNEIIGFIDFFYATPKESYIIPVIKMGNIGVNDKYRRNGIGTALYNSMLFILKDIGDYQIRIQFFPQNLAASEFYKKIGYAEYSVTYQKIIKQSL